MGVMRVVVDVSSGEGRWSIGDVDLRRIPVLASIICTEKQANES